MHLWHCQHLPHPSALSSPDHGDGFFRKLRHSVEQPSFLPRHLPLEAAMASWTKLLFEMSMFTAEGLRRATHCTVCTV